jgi:hypothetical protein
MRRRAYGATPTIATHARSRQFRGAMPGNDTLPSTSGGGVGGPIAEIGLDVLNGDGTRGIVPSTRSSNGVIQDWTNFPPNTGTYTVDPDCTGSFFDANGNKNNIIVLDGGKRFLLLSAEPETIVTSEGTRLEPED